MATRRQDGSVKIQDFVLSRELAEVYLLMDHISEFPNKEIPKSISDPVFTDVRDKKGETWIEQICTIAWPPKGSDPAKAHARNASKLIRAKDALNKAAGPATGGSIAFTVMIAGEARGTRQDIWWRRALRWMADDNRTDYLEADDAEPAGEADGAQSPWGGRKAPSRISLAALAYPALARRAWRYRVALYALLVFLVLWLLLTCVLSWDVATGSSLLNRVTALETRVTTLQSAADDEQSPGAPSNGRAAAPAQGTGTPPPAARQAGTATPPSSEELSRAIELRATARENLKKWMEERDLIRQLLIDRMGGERQVSVATLPAPAGPSARAVPVTETNSEWAAVLLGILASNILPIFYGLLGAGASVVRQVSTRMRDSLLAPRDILLAYVQLALGAVIGACIGLFVNSESSAATAQGGLLSSVPLSASALCFVAGFGVEGVFQALESLTRRVFNTEAPRPASTA